LLILSNLAIFTSLGYRLSATLIIIYNELVIFLFLFFNGFSYLILFIPRRPERLWKRLKLERGKYTLFVLPLTVICTLKCETVSHRLGLLLFILSFHQIFSAQAIKFPLPCLIKSYGLQITNVGIYRLLPFHIFMNTTVLIINYIAYYSIYIGSIYVACYSIYIRSTYLKIYPKNRNYVIFLGSPEWVFRQQTLRQVTISCA